MIKIERKWKEMKKNEKKMKTNERKWRGIAINEELARKWYAQNGACLAKLTQINEAVEWRQLTEGSELEEQLDDPEVEGGGDDEECVD